MLRHLKWGFHPAALIVGLILLVAAAGVVLLPGQHGAPSPTPLPLADGEQEIVWLYPATSIPTWERLASAVHQAQARLAEQFPGLECEHDPAGSSSSATPQLTLSWPRGQGRLVFRWYKLTSQWTPRAWVEALLARRRPPLAIIGGSNTFWARELVLELERATASIPEANRPLLLLTTATADRVPRGADPDDDEPELNPARWSDDSRTLPLLAAYGRRTYRFCFSNRQMATAVTRFIWSQPQLRPDSDPAYLVQWTDDSYSQDFFDGCMNALSDRAADTVAQQWAFASGCLGLRGPPARLAGWFTSGFRNEDVVRLDVDSSVGSFMSPNPFEANVMRDLLRQMEAPRAVPKRPLLVLTGQQQPSRRFLRDLARSAPELARRFVVAMGDAISFNTICRDRQATWPIQDLPFTLVFFAHRNPIDQDPRFKPASQASPKRRTLPSGTEDVLLFRDIVEASALAYRGGAVRSENADEFTYGLNTICLDGDRLRRGGEGVPLFPEIGQRNSGTGEHVVCVQPRFQANRVLPMATIEVWTQPGGRRWERVGQPLTVSFDEFEVLHGERAISN